MCQMGLQRLKWYVMSVALWNWPSIIFTSLLNLSYFANTKHFNLKNIQVLKIFQIEMGGKEWSIWMKLDCKSITGGIFKVP